jgi:cytochrome c5
MYRFLSVALFIVCVGITFVMAVNDAPAEGTANYDAAAGKATYDASCAMCHKTGMMGAPKVGDKAAWKPRIEEGIDSLTAKAIKGYKGAKGMMPAKGGNTKLTATQVGNAVAYMVGQSQ